MINRSGVQLLLCASASLWLLFSCASGSSPASHATEVSRQVYLMGTRCTLIVYAANRQEGLQRLEEFVQILEKTEAELSTWRRDSLLSQLNEHPTGRPFLLNPGLCRMFSQVVFWWQATDSAFDPAIGALIEVWGLRQQGGRPGPGELEAARRRSGMAHLTLDPFCQLVRRRDVKLDTGAFGKGEALDRVLERAAEKGYTRWLIDLGGQVSVQGLPPGEEGWRVSLAHPTHREEALLDILVKSGTLASSGGSERDVWVGGEQIGHIVDPRTGVPVRFQGSVSVWHPQALAADILSTALYVMGPEKGLKWARQRNVAACFLIPAGERSSPKLDVSVQATPAFKEQFF